MSSTRVIKRSTTVGNDDGTTREQVQYTVPLKLADEHDLEGVTFEWTAESEDRRAGPSLFVDVVVD